MAKDLNVTAQKVVDGVFNVSVPFADAAEKLSATETDVLVLTVPGKDALELAYNANKKVFVKIGAQGYSEAEIDAAKVTVKKSTVVTAEELNVTAQKVVDGVYNISVPFADAAEQLGATNSDALVLTVPGKDALELAYNASKNVFVKIGAQGYSEAEIGAATVTLK